MVVKMPTVLYPATVDEEISFDVMLERIDSILLQMYSLRRQMQLMTKTEQYQDITAQLFGVLGQASPKELNYDIDINFLRFNDE